MTQDDGLLERVKAAIGRPLADFVLNIDTETTEVGALSPQQEVVLRQIGGLLTGPLTAQFEPSSLNELLRWQLVKPRENGQPPANELHLMSGGTLPQLSGRDTSSDLISVLARDTYPAFLLPADDLPALAWPGPRESRFTLSALHNHPLEKEFQAAILADPTFGEIFGEDKPHTGRSTFIERSTFQGGGLQLSLLAHRILSNAWRQPLGGGRPRTVADFIDRAKSQLDFMQSALAGKPLTVKARQAFAGVRLPPGTEWVAEKGVIVREATEEDREFAPESLKQQLTGTDESGVTTVVNYDGDIVVEFDYPYKVKAFKEWHDDDSSLSELSTPELLERLSTRLRLSLMVAVQRVHKLQIAPTWQHFGDPFDVGYAVSWADPKQAVGLTPTQLTADDVRAWQEWFLLLGNPHVDRIAVALSRVVRASAERREPSDVLIDSVIAWENLFGTKEGEPTLRVTASLALLLETEPEARRKLRTKLAKIYALRSNVVHGNAALKRDEYSLCYEALDIAIQALRVLLRDRTDVLALPDGAQRSLHLILDQAPTQQSQAEQGDAAR